MTRRTLKTVALLGTALGLIGLAGCATDAQPAVPTAFLEGTPLDRNPITVSKKTEFLEVTLNPADNQLRIVDKNRIRSFVAAYVDHGHGPLIMSMPTNSANAGLSVQAVAEAREIAWEYGVEYEEIAGGAYDARGEAGAPLVMAYQAFRANAPECVQLSELDLADAKSNNELPTFGCAVRTNLAAMIADPADLFGERDLAEGDSFRREVILQKFREGVPTGATRSAEESGAVSTAVQ